MGLQIEEVSAKDLKPYTDDYDILVESSIAEAQSNLADSKNKLTFLGIYKDDQNVNQKVLFETQAAIAGIDDDTIKRLLDMSDYDAVKVVAKADEAFKIIISGKPAPFYKDAGTGFVQHLIDLSEQYDTQLTSEQHKAVFAYIEHMIPIAQQNAARSVSAQMAKAGMISGGGPAPAGTGTSLENPDLAANGGAPLGNPDLATAETAALSG